MTMDLRARIDESRMSSYQWVVVGLCVLLNCLDGFDVMSMAFTAHPVSSEFGLDGSQLGLLLSAGLVGMAIGSLVLAPLADVLGRRPVILLCLALASAGMFLGSVSPSAPLLGASRIVTGLGVGGILASTNVIASEYSSSLRRGLSIGIYTAGYGIGATLGGLASASLVDQAGWRSVFLTGAVVTAAALVLMAVLLPESVDFLLHRRPVGALTRLNRIASRLGHPALTEADLQNPAHATHQARRLAHPGALLGRDLRRSTLLVWVAFFATMFGFYFVNTWTPQLLVTAGLSEKQGITGGLMLALGGTVGSVAFGLVCSRRDTRRVLISFTALAAATMVVFITTTSLLALALAMGVLVGALVNGCIAGLYTLSPALYEPGIRTTGMGWAIGIGRIGAILAPLATGRLLDASWSPVQLYVGAAVVVVVAAVALLLMPSRSRTGVRQATPEPVASRA
jgi:benzoate transport